MSTLSFLHQMSRLGMKGASEALAQYRRERKILKEYQTESARATSFQEGCNLPPVMPRLISDADDSKAGPWAACDD